MERAYAPARYQRYVVGGFLAFAVAVEIPTVIDPGRGGNGLRVAIMIFIAVSAVAMVRALRSATVIATDDGVVYRSLLRTRSWPWKNISRFEALDTAVGAVGWNRRVLYLHEKQGSTQKLEEINARAARSPNPVDEVARELNGLLSELGHA